MTLAPCRTGSGGTAPAPIPPATETVAKEIGAPEMRHRVIGLLVGLSLLATSAAGRPDDTPPTASPDRHILA
ncbi:hypothetical protein [Devosia enhydra]|nr:hypothetical protein [Devosia enhydra]